MRPSTACLARIFIGLTLSLILSLMSDPVSASSWDDLFFENQIRPVLVEKCLPCHSQKHAESGLRVDSLASLLEGGDSGPAINTTHPEQSLLLRAIAGDSDVSAMPPQAENRLRPDQIQDFKIWVADGAQWPRELSTLINTKLWSLDPPRKVSPSTHANSTGSQHPIDRLIGARVDTLGRIFVQRRQANSFASSYLRPNRPSPIP